MLYSMRSERRVMEKIDNSVLIRRFVGLNLDGKACDSTTFTKNRNRLPEAKMAKELLAQMVEPVRAVSSVSGEPLTVPFLFRPKGSDSESS
jgi:transposase